MLLFWILITTIVNGNVFGAEDVGSIELKSNVTKLGANVTLTCSVTTNASVTVSSGNDLQWDFTPVGQNVSIVVLKQRQNSNGQLMMQPVSTPAGGNQNGGGFNPSRDMKYVRSGNVLTIVNAGMEDAGQYTCTLPGTSLAATGELYVVDKGPNCTDNTGRVFYESDNETLGCSIRYHGNHPPSLDWQLSPSLKSPFYQHLKTQHNNTPMTVSTSLHLELPAMIDGKIFSCYARFPNISTSYLCDTMFPPDSIRYSPFITHIHTNPHTQVGNYLAELGSNMTLYCGGHGNPKPTFTWTFYSDEEAEQIVLPCSRTACVLRNLTLRDQGTYICKVSNTIRQHNNSATKSIYLKVVAKTPPGYPGPEKSTVRTLIYTSLPPSQLEASSSSKGVSKYAIAAIVCASLAIILIIVFILLALKMRTRERHLHERLSRMHDENLDDQEVELLDENIQPDNIELPAEYGRLKQQFEIPRKDIRLVDLIAKGSFVEVWRGRMRKYPRRNDIMKVAIKRITSEATEKERKFFLAELEVMKAIQAHPNILPLIGCYTASDPWLMMVEYAVEGSLYQFLQHRRPGGEGELRVEIHAQDGRDAVSLKGQNLTAHRLLSLGAQVVNGLQHINKFKMIYYRLRAASVLVVKGGMCKLAGFGFPADITERNIYETNSAPVRWMSPESLLDNVYNVKTDVWAFGILLWEIIHFGHLPYPDMGPHEVVEKIQTGYRMPQPQHCSGDTYNLMLMCWAQSPENRPSFGDIMQNLTHLAEYADNNIMINKLPEGLKCADIVENNSATA